MSVAKLHGVTKAYQVEDVKVVALSNINVEIQENRFTVISGQSGSGKTTLLNLIGCIDRADQGEVIVAGETVQTKTDDALSDFRSKNLGFIFQNFNLLSVLTVAENIEYPLFLLHMPAGERQRRVATLMQQVGLADRAHHRPGQLSGGQRQRVAIARALAPSPQIVLADEPTANLDSKTGASIIALMRQMQREHKVSFIFSSHDPHILAEADDAISIHDGSIAAVERKTQLHQGGV